MLEVDLSDFGIRVRREVVEVPASNRYLFSRYSRSTPRSLRACSSRGLFRSILYTLPFELVSGIKRGCLSINSVIIIMFQNNLSAYPNNKLLFHAVAKMNFSGTIRDLEQPEAHLNMENVVNQPCWTSQRYYELEHIEIFKRD